MVKLNINLSNAKPFARNMRGITTVSVAIAIIVAGMLTLASARYAINQFNESRGNLVGNQLQTVADALEAYIEANNAALSKAETRAGSYDKKTVISNFLPSPDKLKTDRHLTSNFSSTPSYGGNYVIKIEVTPRAPSNLYPCVNDCNIRGFVYLSEPITSSGSTTDIRILGAAVNASAKKNVGFSLPQTPNVITGPGGWTEPNPLRPKAGILFAVTSLSNDFSNTQYWLKPRMNHGSLPPSTNFDGDGRIALDTYKPYIWNASATTPQWMELFSNRETQSLSIGTESGSTDSTMTTPSETKNTFIGYQAGRFNTSGSNNIFLGPFTGTNNNSGSSNIFIGPFSGQNNKQAPSISAPSDNTFIGLNSGKSNNGNFGTFIGNHAGEKNTTGSGNIFIGYNSGFTNTTGFGNTFLGKDSGISNTASSNTLLGFRAGYNNTIGMNNLFSGYDSGFKNNTGSNNTFYGFNSGYNTIAGSENTFSGSDSGNKNIDGKNNVFNGYKAGYALEGNNNTAIGSLSGYAGNTTISVSGVTAIGSLSLTKATNSTSIGYNAQVLTANSTAIGTDAKILSPLAINSMAIGYGSTVGEANTVRIGNDLVQKIDIGKANLITTGDMSANNITATTVSSSSDKRLKENITDTPRDLSFIKKLRPVDYTLISNGKPQTGFIAQEVESADPDFPGIVKPQNDRDFYALTYTAFIPAIVKSIQQLDARLDKIAPATLATSATAPASVSGLANGAAPAPASADLSLLKWLVLFLSVCVLSCLAVIVRFYKELQAMRLSVQRLHKLAA